MILNIFSCAYLPSIDILWRNAYSSPLPIKKIFFNCWVIRVLCIFRILILYQIYDLPIFSPILWVALWCTKRLFWWSPIYVLFSIVAYSFGVISNKSLSNPMSGRLSPVFFVFVFYEFCSFSSLTLLSCYKSWTVSQSSDCIGSKVSAFLKNVFVEAWVFGAAYFANLLMLLILFFFF